MALMFPAIPAGMNSACRPGSLQGIFQPHALLPLCISRAQHPHILSCDLQFGLFHGDPHPGNIFALRDGRIAYVDFGNVAELSQRNKAVLIDAVVHAVNNDYESMAQDFMNLVGARPFFVSVWGASGSATFIRCIVSRPHEGVIMSSWHPHGELVPSTPPVSVMPLYSMYINRHAISALARRAMKRSPNAAISALTSSKEGPMVPG